MSDENSETEHTPEELQGRRYTWVIPIITVVVVVAVVIIGLMLESEYVDPGTVPTAPEQMPSAEEIYLQNCAVCHGEEGQGASRRYPPLVDTRWVKADRERLILITLHGLRGPVEVHGRTFDDIMPPFGHRLSNEEIAQVLSYIRRNFGNDADAIAAEEIEQLREEFTPPQAPWTAERLQNER